MAKPIGPKEVRRDSKEFKRQAVHLALHPDIQTQDVAKALDMHPCRLFRRTKEYREGSLKPSTEVKKPKLPGGGEDKALSALTTKVDALTRKVDAPIKRRAVERR